MEQALPEFTLQVSIEVKVKNRQSQLRAMEAKLVATSEGT